ncbi:uncharacterized protein [Aristolochia californica]|uniref:uncharacterized protein n=1 Tax=Aristolochia californica TaxID=171875 RepID=UPI0035E295FB
MDQRRAKGLYNNCDEQYLPGHQCKRLFWLEVDDSKDTPPLEAAKEPEEEEPTIFLHAMMGLHSTNTMQVRPVLQHLTLLALVDSGSTINFISHPVAQQWLAYSAELWDFNFGSPKPIVPRATETTQPPKTPANTTLAEFTDPTESYKEALKQPGWKAAMDEEMQALYENQTWALVPLLSDKKPVGWKWVFTVKHNPDGSVARLKVRLMAKAYTQCYGIDYEETFSPLAKMNSVGVLLSLAANSSW